MNVPLADTQSSWTVRLDSRRRPTLPEEVLRSAGLAVGQPLRVHVAEVGCLIIETPAHALKRARSRIVRGPDHSVVDEFLAERVEAGLTVVPMGWQQASRITTVVALATAATDGGVE